MNKRFLGLLFAGVIMLTLSGCSLFHQHVEQALPEKAPTCIETGLGSGVKCADCGEILTEQSVLPALGHKPEAVPAAAATCTAEGLGAHERCTVCGTAMTQPEVTPALGHKAKTLPAVEPTCLKVGRKEGSECTVCHEVLVAQEMTPALGHQPEAMEAKAAACTEDGLTAGSKCGTCGVVIERQKTIAALGHTTASGTCTRCGESQGSWTVKYFVDKFDMPTDEWYITSKTRHQGVFSNSATKDSALRAQIVVSETSITIFLYEYEKYLVDNSFSSAEYYNITMRLGDGSTKTMTGSMNAKNGDRIFIKSQYESTVLDALKSGDTLYFYIENDDRPINNYLFTVDTSNFAAVYEQQTK